MMEVVPSFSDVPTHSLWQRRQPGMLVTIGHLVLADLYKLRCQKRLLFFVTALYFLLLLLISAGDTLIFLNNINHALYDSSGSRLSHFDKIVFALQSVRLPFSFVLSVMLAVLCAPIPLSILVTSLIGTDYRSGMLRLLLARGLSRTSYYLGKLATIFLVTTIFICIATILMLVYRWLVVQLVLPGIPNPDFVFSWTWLLTALWTIVQAILVVFLYGLIAYFLTLLTRSPAVGIAGCLALWIVEFFVTLQIAASFNGAQNTTAQWIRFLPKNTSESLINGMIPRLIPFGHGNWHDISSIFVDQTHTTFSQNYVPYLVSLNQDSATIAYATGNYYGLSLWSQAITVLLCYLFVLLVANGWLQVRRDVTS